MVFSNYVAPKSGPELNAKISRAIMAAVSEYRDIVGGEWQCCIEFCREDDKLPFYAITAANMPVGKNDAANVLCMLKDLESAYCGGQCQSCGIRIPYEAFVTTHDEPKAKHKEEPSGDVFPLEGAILVAFSGCPGGWQNLFFCFQIFAQIQKILNELWTADAIRYDLGPCREDYHMTKFWIQNLNIKEALI